MAHPLFIIAIKRAHVEQFVYGAIRLLLFQFVRITLSTVEVETTVSVSTTEGLKMRCNIFLIIWCRILNFSSQANVSVMKGRENKYDRISNQTWIQENKIKTKLELTEALFNYRLIAPKHPRTASSSRSITSITALDTFKLNMAQITWDTQRVNERERKRDNGVNNYIYNPLRCIFNALDITDWMQYTDCTQTISHSKLWSHRTRQNVTFK